jgi:hypothetical protein
MVTVDIAGSQMGGAARFAEELRAYLGRSGRHDVRVVGADRRVDPRWLLRREVTAARGTRLIAANNVSFVVPGAERWTLLRNALHFLAPAEAAALDPHLRASVRREAALVRLCARRSDLIVVPCAAMRDRVAGIMPDLRDRIVTRPHPVSAEKGFVRSRGKTILCPVLFAPYKPMGDRLTELMAAITGHSDPSVRVRVTATPAEVPPTLSTDPRLEFLGRLDPTSLSMVRARSTAIYFPTSLESFGYPLAEARAHGQPVIALDTAQNQEIAGSALCGFRADEPESLRAAVSLALTRQVDPDPAPFDPDAYFDWILGDHR